MATKDNLFYRADLRPDKNYRSEAIIENKKQYTETIIQEEKPTIIEQLEEIKEIIAFIPQDTSTIVENIIDTIANRINIAFPDGEKINSLEPETHNQDDDISAPIVDSNNKTYDYAIGTTLIEESEDTVELPVLFPNPTNIKIDILYPKSLVDVARDTYSNDTIDLKEDYIKKLQTVMQKYLQSMVMIMSETGIDDISLLTKKYDGDAVIIPNPNLQHLGDYIVRSQITREQKNRLFKKTHNIDQTLMHMRSWHVAEQQRERYYAEEYGNSETYLNSQSNKILRESRAAYDKRYNQTLYDMYKYLNSSVMIINDTLQMSLQEAHSKGMLLKNGINIFATTESAKIAAATIIYQSGSSTTNTSSATPDININSTKIEQMIKNKHDEFMIYIESVKEEVVHKGSLIIEFWNYIQTGEINTLVPILKPEEIKSAANYKELSLSWETAFSISKNVIGKINNYNTSTYLITVDELKTAGSQAEAQATAEYENNINRIKTVLSNFDTIKNQASSMFTTFN